MFYERLSQRRWWPIYGAVAGLLMLGCQSLSNALPDISSNSASAGQRLPITAQAIVAGQTIDLEVAQTQDQQAMGLMFRDSLPDNRGMLFPFNPPRNIGFWMKNVPVPLDMVFLYQGKVVGIEASAPPCKSLPCPTYSPQSLVDNVLELRAGRAAELGLKNGIPVQVQTLPESKTQ
ncbi:MAG: DUF192 domain-containing protein [Thermosynechococcaceae cyanobacterium]